MEWLCRGMIEKFMSRKSFSGLCYPQWLVQGKSLTIALWSVQKSCYFNIYHNWIILLITVILMLRVHDNSEKASHTQNICKKEPLTNICPREGAEGAWGLGGGTEARQQIPNGTRDSRYHKAFMLSKKLGRWLARDHCLGVIYFS